MRMLVASSRDMPDGLALAVVVMTAEEVRAADWASLNEDIPEAAFAFLKDELPGQTEIAFGRWT